MAEMKKLWMIVAFAPFLFGSVEAQTNPSRAARLRSAPASRDRCTLNGTYRVDPANSDRLYSVVRNAQSTVPFGDQQQFFIDLTTRLTPPDLLGIECIGRQVSVGSSRANKITYLADGKTRRETGTDGSLVNSRITLAGDALTFVSTGRAEDNVNIAFEALEGGRRLRVTRRIYAKQLTEPIVIRTFYDRMSPGVEWDIFGRDDLVARQSANSQPVRSYEPRETPSARNRADSLRRDFASWLAATNRRDIEGQMRFYMPQMKAFYLTRNTPSRAVRIEKQKIFGAARSVDIRTGEPEIVFQNQGQIAVMRFVKEYRVSDRSRTRSGAVIQELRWQRVGNGWRIFSERDVRVIR
jgi:ketosteroid isomerase-like protein